MDFIAPIPNTVVAEATRPNGCFLLQNCCQNSMDWIPTRCLGIFPGGLIRPTLCNRLLAASGHPLYSKGRYPDPQWYCTILRICERVSQTPARRQLVRTVGQTMMSHDLLKQDVHGVMTACVRFFALCTLPGDSETVPIVILGVVGKLGPDQLRHHNFQTFCIKLMSLPGVVGHSATVSTIRDLFRRITKDNMAIDVLQDFSTSLASLLDNDVVLQVINELCGYDISLPDCPKWVVFVAKQVIHSQRTPTDLQWDVLKVLDVFASTQSNFTAFINELISCDPVHGDLILDLMQEMTGQEREFVGTTSSYASFTITTRHVTNWATRIQDANSSFITLEKMCEILLAMMRRCRAELDFQSLFPPEHQLRTRIRDASHAGHRCCKSIAAYLYL